MITHAQARRHLLASGLAALATPGWPASGAAGSAITQRPLNLKPGAPGVRVKGRIRGDASVDYTLQARAGQLLRVQLAASNRSAYFNLLPADGDEALFIGSTSGDRYEGRLPADGVYRLQVYLMRNAARRDEQAAYSLDVALYDEMPAPAPARAAFDTTLDLQGIAFHVSATRQGATSLLRIAPGGLTVDNTPVARTVAGSVVGAEVADLNVDGSPEVYVYVRSNVAGSPASVIAFAANRRRSLSDIHLPELPAGAAAARGYRGHDEWAVVESVLVRRFPVYRAGDVDAYPSGGMRQLQYRLVPGEAGWRLRLARVVAF